MMHPKSKNLSTNGLYLKKFLDAEVAFNLSKADLNRSV